MSSTIFEFLKEYQLDNPQNLPQRLREMSPSNWLRFSYGLDKLYANTAAPAPSDSGLTPLTFCFPSLPYKLLPSISAHLLVADRVFLDDPLYDLVAMLSNAADPFRKKDINDYSFLWAKEKLITEIAGYISFYYRAKELIGEGKLIPYKQITLPDSALTFQEILLVSALKDRKLRNLFGKHDMRVAYAILIWRSVLARFFKKKMDLRELSEYIGESKYLTQFVSETISTRPLLSSLSQLALSGGLQGLSTDFISPDYAYAFRKTLDIANQINKNLSPDKRLLLPAAFSLNGIELPNLQNIPIERVLETISSEPSAFETFRTSVNERLTEISAPAGSIEREKQILAIREKVSHDIASINLAYSEIQKSFSKKFALHVILGASSILVAGLATIGQNLNVLALTGGIAAGTTLGSSVKEFAKDWLEYQRELLKMKSNENYFVWKLLSRDYLRDK